ncbi:hypothetical protein [Micrococcus luteus]|uniref:hypothetical protein n=1 Tax=Micrococcus luteus TaxID=1270 RepID=UPI0020CD9734|nr:hypothetical protein [Micrococcus luteus]UTT46522.1 hypothetical protein NMQ02_04735 [Micrococcus luteus]
MLLALPAVLSRRWFQWSAPLTLALSLAAVVGSVLTTASGEQLAASDGEASAVLRQHAQLGETTRNLAILLFLLLLVWTALSWHRSPVALRCVDERLPALHLALAALVLLVGVADVVVSVQAGHAGAQLVWQGEGSGTQSGGGLGTGGGRP